jgi:hypothetical protein
LIGWDAGKVVMKFDHGDRGSFALGGIRLSGQDDVSQLKLLYDQFNETI